MATSEKDLGVLRGLASKVAEIAALPVQAKTISDWKALNRLKPVRPMLMIDQVPWHEMDVDGELTLVTSDAFARSMETEFRRTLYSWNHLRADMVVEPAYVVPKVIRGMDWGISTIDETSVGDPENSVVGHAYIDQLKDEADADKIRNPRIVFDVQATARLQEQAQEILQGILPVYTQGWMPFFCPWDVIVQWHPPETLLFDLACRPEFMHRAVSRLTDAYLSMLDQMEEQGVLSCGQGTIHCSGAYNDELPAAGFDAKRPRAKDVWTCGMAQIFSSVSPGMHQEFELEYATKWYSRFGLVYYGCCEPLDRKLDIVKKIPNLRKISMSCWVDVEKGAEQIGRDFVFSNKPNPAFLALEEWDPASVRRDLKKTLDACAANGCPAELILKDISTVRYQPKRLWEWADLAAKLVGK